MIFRLATKTLASTRDIAAKIPTNASHSTLWRCLKEDRRAKYKKIKVKPALTEEHKRARRDWAKKYM
jgi:hypothetical protein